MGRHDPGSLLQLHPSLCRPRSHCFGFPRFDEVRLDYFLLRIFNVVCQQQGDWGRDYLITHHKSIRVQSTG